MTVDALLSGWLGGLARICWQGSLAVALVWVVNLVLKRGSAAVRAGLWWIACAKCLLAFGVAAFIALPLLKQADPTLADQAPARFSSHGIASVPPAIAEAPGGQPNQPENIALEIAFALWALGVIGVGGRTAFQARKLWGILLRSSPLDFTELGETARVLGAKMGLDASPRVAESAEVGAPVIVGALKPKIILPIGLRDRLDESEIRMVIAHELAHGWRRDLLTGLVPALCQHLLFFFPPAWLAVRGWTLESEAACDAKALAVTQASPCHYAQMLMKIVAQDSRAVALSPALGATNSYHTLRMRFEMMKSFSTTGTRAQYHGLLLVAGAVFLAMPWKVTARPEPAQSLPTRFAQPSLHEGGSSTILCRVLSADGKPMAGVTVFAQHNPDRKRFDGAIGMGTNTSGEVTFDVNWSDLRNESFRASTDDQYSDPIVRPVDGVAVIRLHRINLASVQGVVRDAKGKPQSGVRVFISFDGTLSFQGNLDILGERETGPDGSYRFNGIYPGIPIFVGASIPNTPQLSTPKVRTVAGIVQRMPDLRIASGH